MRTRPEELDPAYLERHPEAGGPVERIPLLKLPLTVGRGATADHIVYSSKVSKEHAAIVASGGRYAVRDLGSTNGTFVNGQRTVSQVLEDGDIIHIAHVEFCFRYAVAPEDEVKPAVESESERTQLVLAEQPDSIIRGTELLREMIRVEAANILYQPIVDISSRSIIGYEALARGTHPGLSSHPAMLLQLAERCGLVVELSQMFGRLAVRSSGRLPGGTSLFVNMHPNELTDPGLFQSLTELRALGSDDHPIVIEVPESSVTDVVAMARNKEAFASLGLAFAYDDFGAGQARLIELTDAPPDYLKFDKALIQGIDTVGARQEMVGALLTVARGLGVRAIGEGIETDTVAEICRRLGCEYGQGYLFGRPA